MTDERFDQKMRCALSPLAADTRLKRRVKQKMEEEMMTKKNIRRSLVAGICGCLAFAGIALAAASAVRTWTTSNSRNDEVYTYEQVAEVEEKLGFDFRVPVSIAEGYADPEVTIRDNTVSGEDGKALYTYKDAFVSYAKDGAGWISLSASKREDLDQESSQDEAIQVYDETREIDGIAVGVMTQNYKFVPENHELTEEEQAAIDEGNLIVSYGTEEVEEMTMASAYFDIEDVAYVIVDSNGSDMENMFAMAEKVIRAE